ncbi:MAG: SGNH/GDSL hydrolase family protein [Thermoanaerobaculia bacterium]
MTGETRDGPTTPPAGPLDPSRPGSSRRLSGRGAFRAAATNAFLLGASTLVALGLAEAGARLFVRRQAPVTVENAVLAPPGPSKRLETKADAEIASVILFGGPNGVRLRPNTRAVISKHVLSGREVTLEINSLGLRAPEIGPKGSDEFRVLVLGDSIVFGDFVLESETFTARLEALAAGRRKRIHFFNAGLPGAGTAEELALFREIGRTVRPDLVLLAMYLNDAQSGSLFFGRRLPDPWAKSAFLTWAAERWQLLDTRFFRDALPGEVPRSWREEFRAGRNLRSGDMFGTKDGFDFEVYNAYMDFGLAWNDKAWDIVSAITAALKRSVTAQGAQMAMLLFPVHLQVLGTYEDRHPQEKAGAMAKRLGLPFLDPLPFLRADWHERHERLFYDHCHYTPHGYDVLARETLEWLTARGLVPR